MRRSKDSLCSLLKRRPSPVMCRNPLARSGQNPRLCFVSSKNILIPSSSTFLSGFSDLSPSLCPRQYGAGSMDSPCSCRPTLGAAGDSILVVRRAGGSGPGSCLPYSSQMGCDPSGGCSACGVTLCLVGCRWSP